MIPGDAAPDRVAMASTLRRVAEKPTDFTYGEISTYARMAAEMIMPTPQRVAGVAKRPDGSTIEWEQTEIHDVLNG